MQPPSNEKRVIKAPIPCKINFHATLHYSIKLSLKFLLVSYTDYLN